MTKNKPAIISNIPIFTEELPFMQPTLPPIESYINEIHEISNSGFLTKGKYLEKYEETLAEYIGVPYVLALSSCTTGLILSLKGLGITGDVLVPSFTFCASAHSIVWAGATPVFVDCYPGTYTMDVEDAERKITKDTTCILAVHVFGVPANVEAIQDLANKYDLKVVYDAAHAMGSKLNGVPIGVNGDAEVFSTSPTKLLVTGEGGFVATHNRELANYIKLAREYGNPGNYDCTIVGINGRLNEYSSVIGINSLKVLENNIEMRNMRAQQYRENLSEIPGIVIQTVPSNVRSTFKDLSILIEPDIFGLNRDQLELALKYERIPTRKYFSPAVHEQICYQSNSNTISKLPTTEYISKNIISLPLFSHMSSEQVEKVIQAIQNIHENAEEISKLELQV